MENLIRSCQDSKKDLSWNHIASTMTEAKFSTNIAFNDYERLVEACNKITVLHPYKMHDYRFYPTFARKLDQITLSQAESLI